jgi:hypothetical protein
MKGTLNIERACCSPVSQSLSTSWSRFGEKSAWFGLHLAEPRNMCVLSAEFYIGQRVNIRIRGGTKRDTLWNFRDVPTSQVTRHSHCLSRCGGL